MTRARRSNRTGVIVVECIDVVVTWKPIRHLHLRVVPPGGEVRISAPYLTPESDIRRFVDTRLPWILHHRDRIRAAARPLLEAEDGVPLVHWGEQFQLMVVERPGRARVACEGGVIRLHVPPGTDADGRLRVLHRWQRAELHERLAVLIPAWQPVVGREAAEWRIRRMRTRWGTCNTRDRRLWFNLELVMRPPACVEYVVVHELVHLRERLHNARFWGYMDAYLPDWRERRNALNAGATGIDDLADVKR